MSLQVQPTLFAEPSPTDVAVDRLAKSDVAARGAVFTRREVVEFILDLVRYTPARPVHRERVLEPSFGGGDFLLPLASRLVASWRAAGGEDAGELRDSLRAVELHRATFLSTRDALRAQLVGDGIGGDAADGLLAAWLANGDFLLTPLAGAFDYVVGNPPYVRQEMIAGELLAEYRRRYRTLYDRADLYVPFIERSLASLSRTGSLGFICADRWMKNQYGGPLREMVARGFRLDAYVDMVDTPAFTSDVIAYPAITIISRGRPGPTRVAYKPTVSRDVLADLSRRLLSPAVPDDGTDVRELSAVTSGKEPWILHGSDQLELVRRLEARWPTIEAAGCEVGIGVATGADAAFIGPFDALDVEPDRKLPLAMTRDVASGAVKWRGLGVVNPFDDHGGVVDLTTYPRLGRYLEARRDVIGKRHVAARTPAAWYRTIDRIYPSLAVRPKLLIPDIKGEAHVVYEDGRLYPHHNLYFITSATWDLRALQAVLLSGLAKLFVAAYSTRMRGGFLRFQAQYLRRIRLPEWSDMSPRLRGVLTEAAMTDDRATCNRTVFDLYGLTDVEREVISRDGGGDAA